MATTWQIWLSKDGTEGTTCIKKVGVEVDLDGNPMDLLHEYIIEGAPNPDDDTHVKAAFAYADHWRHETPEGQKALQERE